MPATEKAKGEAPTTEMKVKTPKKPAATSAPAAKAKPEVKTAASADKQEGAKSKSASVKDKATGVVKKVVGKASGNKAGDKTKDSQKSKAVEAANAVKVELPKDTAEALPTEVESTPASAPEAIEAA